RLVALTAVEQFRHPALYCINVTPTLPLHSDASDLGFLTSDFCPGMPGYSLTHLKQLEAESIHVIREVVAEFENPVMLYSIGKDSSVMVRLAEKAFYPAKPPFPLMHVDTTWKFREMYALRDNYVAKELGLKLIVHINEEGR